MQRNKHVSAMTRFRRRGVAIYLLTLMIAMVIIGCAPFGPDLNELRVRRIIRRGVAYVDFGRLRRVCTYGKQQVQTCNAEDPTDLQ